MSVVKDINRIQESFSRAAKHYDDYSLFHQKLGARLIASCGELAQDATILDVGMGTGLITHKLAQTYPCAKVLGCDFAPKMVERAQQYQTFKAIQADAQALPCQDQSVDLIYSNLAYQWVRDLTQAFSECARALKPKGVFVASIFGYDTFQEFFIALQESAVDKIKPRVEQMQRLYRREMVEQNLKAAGFDRVVVTSEKMILTFEDIFDLMRWNKMLGSNILVSDFRVGKQWLLRAQEYYQKHFSRKDQLIEATAEIIWVKVGR